MGSHFFLRTSSIIGGDTMVYLLIYLNMNCILLWLDFIFRKKAIKKDLSEIDGLDEFGNVTLMILAIFTIVLAVITILPFYIYKGIKRLL